MENTNAVATQQPERTFTGATSPLYGFATGLFGFVVLLQAVLAIVQRWHAFSGMQKFDGVVFVTFLLILLAFPIVSGIRRLRQAQMDCTLIALAFMVAMLAMDLFAAS